MPTATQIVQKFFPNVKDVVDADRAANIEVTRPDVVKSNRMAHKTCAMAVACKRKFHLDGVIISMKTAYLIKGTKARRFRIDGSVARELVSFDRGGEFAPGDYQLKAVPPTSRLDRPKIKGNGHGSNNNQKRRTTAHLTKGVRVSLLSKMAAA